MDRELYLPKSRTEDRDRCRAARIPDDRDFHTKGDLAKALALRALASDPPFARVTADSAHGREGRFRRLLEQSGLGYVLAAPKSRLGMACPCIDRLFAQAPTEAWERISCGDGAKGPRVNDRTAIRLPAVAEYDHRNENQTRRRWAPARRSTTRPDEIAYHLAYAQLDTTAAEPEAAGSFEQFPDVQCDIGPAGGQRVEVQPARLRILGRAAGVGVDRARLGSTPIPTWDAYTTTFVIRAAVGAVALALALGIALLPAQLPAAVPAIP
ncbi:transposase [Embleya hyalina]|uniref:Transposase n=1 Tax=Embleya hyalina TaxID=516124 RepID=A0A401Z1E7_9ACTN|nr:transposase [Embleya hyalina]